MIDWHSPENAVADHIGAPVESAPLLIGQPLSQHEQAPDKVLHDRAHACRNTLEAGLFAHDARSLRSRLLCWVITFALMTQSAEVRDRPGSSPDRSHAHSAQSGATQETEDRSGNAPRWCGRQRCSRGPGILLLNPASAWFLLRYLPSARFHQR